MNYWFKQDFSLVLANILKKLSKATMSDKSDEIDEETVRATCSQL